MGEASIALILAPNRSEVSTKCISGTSAQWVEEADCFLCDLKKIGSKAHTTGRGSVLQSL